MIQRWQQRGGPRQRAKRSASGTARGSAVHKKTSEEHAENEAAKKNENLKNAYGKCVSSKTKAHKDGLDAKDEEKAEELKNAAKKCAAERGEMGTEAFAAEYDGNNRNRRNAFGKCVSKRARESND